MKKVLKKCFVELDGQDVSNNCHHITIETDRDEVDVTGFQAENKETLAGLGDATITLGIWNDYAAAGIDALLFPLSKSDTPFTVTIRPDAAPVGADNPEYAMEGLLFGYNPIDGDVGDAADTEVPIRNADQAGLTRAVI